MSYMRDKKGQRLDAIEVPDQLATARRMVVVSDNTFGAGSASNSQAATGGFTTRTPHMIPNDVTDLRLVFSNAYVTNTTFLDTDNPNTLTLKAAVEVGGVIYPITFNGARQISLDGGGAPVSDPLAVEVAAGTIIYSRTYVLGTTYFPNRGIFVSAGYGGRAAGDSTYSGTINDSGAYGFGPAAILGTTSATQVGVLIIGDSIADGIGDRTGGQHQGVGTGVNAGRGGGFIQRSLRGVCGLLSLAQSSELATGFAAQAGHLRRMAMSRFATHAIVQYGRNDITASHSLATIQADLVTIWGLCKRRGVKAAQTTTTPLSTTTDGFSTLVNQTAGVNESVRVALNTWLRDGAPLVAGAPVAAGTTGGTVARCAYYSAIDTLVTAASGPTHPLVAVIEVADTVESARNSSLWKVTGRAITDAATTAASQTVTSATANFVSGDYGAAVWIAGAGAAGASHQSWIATVNSSTQITLDSAPATTVSGAVANIGGSTLDGTHPSPSMHAAMGTALPRNWMSL